MSCGNPKCTHPDCLDDMEEQRRAEAPAPQPASATTCDCHSAHNPYGKTPAVVFHGNMRDYFVDACIAPVVKLLHANGIETRASCCGHGEMAPDIMIAPGHELHEVRALIRTADARLFHLHVDPYQEPTTGDRIDAAMANRACRDDLVAPQDPGDCPVGCPIHSKKPEDRGDAAGEAAVWTRAYDRLPPVGMRVLVERDDATHVGHREMRNGNSLWIETHTRKIEHSISDNDVWRPAPEESRAIPGRAGSVFAELVNEVKRFQDTLQCDRLVRGHGTCFDLADPNTCHACREYTRLDGLLERAAVAEMRADELSVDHAEFLFRTYAFEDDKNLTADAQELKRRLRAAAKIDALEEEANAEGLKRLAAESDRDASDREREEAEKQLAEREARVAWLEKKDASATKFIDMLHEDIRSASKKIADANKRAERAEAELTSARTERDDARKDARVNQEKFEVAHRALERAEAERDEAIAKVATLQTRTQRHERAKNLGQAVEADIATMNALIAERDDARKRVGELEAALRWIHCHCEGNLAVTLRDVLNGIEPVSEAQKEVHMIEDLAYNLLTGKPYTFPYRAESMKNLRDSDKPRGGGEGEG